MKLVPASALTPVKRPRGRRLRAEGDGWAEVLYPGKQLGLRLTLNDLPERVIHAIREWRGISGLRHWIALQDHFQHLAHLDNFRWSLEPHMEALGYSVRERADPTLRLAVVAEVEAMGSMEIAVYRPDGTVRVRGAAITAWQRGDVQRGDVWITEAIEFVLHPIFHKGVPDPLGMIRPLWAPAALSLLQIDARATPSALALGLVLPIRWQWAPEGDEGVTLTGAKLLESAGIPFSARNPVRVWAALRQCLDALVRVGALGGYAWSSEGSWSLSGRCALRSPSTRLALAVP